MNLVRLIKMAFQVISYLMLRLNMFRLHLINLAHLSLGVYTSSIYKLYPPAINYQN